MFTSCSEDSVGLTFFEATGSPILNRSTALSTFTPSTDLSLTSDGSLFLFYEERINSPHPSVGLGVRGYIYDDKNSLRNVGTIKVGASDLEMTEGGYYDYDEEGSNSEDIKGHRGATVNISIEGAEFFGNGILTTVEVPSAMNIETNGFAHEVSISEDLILNWTQANNDLVGNTYFSVCGIDQPCELFELPKDETTLTVSKEFLQSINFEEEDLFVYVGRGIESCLVTETGFELCIYSLNSGWRSFKLVE